MNRRAFLAGSAGMPALLANAAADDGFTSLFDGKSLQGWTVEQGPPSAFYVNDGAIVIHESADDPTWLRSGNSYENFDFRGEFFIRGWCDSGIYIHAPLHGKPISCGIRVNIFQQKDETPKPNSCGSIFPIIAPRVVNVKNKGEWNDFRILADWPSLKVWMNGELVQDVDMESHPDLRYRLRRGYLGLVNLSYPVRFRNLRIRELPSKEKWDTLYAGPADLEKWFISDGKPRFETLGDVLWADGLGNLATKEKYRDFKLQMYVRAARGHNSGVMFRSTGKSPAQHYEIQLHNVEGAHYPTGSLYHIKRAIYPRIEDEKWFLFQMFVQGRRCVVRVNGDNVMEYDDLQNMDEGQIELQAHRLGRWTEFKKVLIQRL